MFKPKIQFYSRPFPNRTMTRVFGNPPGGVEDVMEFVRANRIIFTPRGEAAKRVPFLCPEPKLPPPVRRAQIAKKGWHTFQTHVLEAHQNAHLRSSYPDSSERKAKKKGKKR